MGSSRTTWGELSRDVFAGGLAGLLAGISSDNRDFEILDPPTVNVMLFVLIIVLAGVATAVGDQALAQRLPVTSAFAGACALLSLIAVLPVAPLLLAAYFSNETCRGCSGVDNPPFLVWRAAA